MNAGKSKRRAEIGTHEKFMARAIALALENIRARGGGPFGALVVRGGKIIGAGVNSVVRLNDPTAHAEILAIREACRKLKSFELNGCDIYATCEPCPMCLGAIYWARPARIFYAARATDAAKIGFQDGFIYREISRPPSRRKFSMFALMRREALAVFAEWERKPDKIRY